jgi:hypothetical protein
MSPRGAEFSRAPSIFFTLQAAPFAESLSPKAAPSVMRATSIYHASRRHFAHAAASHFLAQSTSPSIARIAAN